MYMPSVAAAKAAVYNGGGGAEGGVEGGVELLDLPFAASRCI